MGLRSIAFDSAHNPTQLSAELRAAGLNAYVADQGSNRFWVYADESAALSDINTVIAAHVPALGTLPSSIALSNGLLVVALTTAVTANVTTTTAPAGSIGITSHATGVGKLFMSDGSKWQFAVVA